MKNTIRARFDEVLYRHFERLIGTRQGIGGMPLNLATIGCIVLLGGRESEIKDSLSHAPERHTHDTLLREATDLGIGPDDSLESALKNMIQKGYCEADSENRFFSRPPIITMTRLLDLIFPKMTGINFLAFIGQTMEEAVSGRTDIEAALSRLDQTLQHQGVPFSKNKSIHTNAMSPAGSARNSDADLQNGHIHRERILAELYSRNKASQQSVRTSLRVLSGGIAPGKSEIKEIFPEKTISPYRNAQKEKLIDKDLVSTTDCQLLEKAHENTAGDEIILTIPEKTASFNSQDFLETAHDLAIDKGDTTLLEDKEESALLVEETCGEDTIVSDDAIADKIAAFESNLALKCPICSVNTLKEHITAAGKTYYTCPSESCNFISWGKPHHLECRRCKNPFLIEVTDAAGNTILKCPRATCQHRQDSNPPGKLVRKRLVRRRK